MSNVNDINKAMLDEMNDDRIGGRPQISLQEFEDADLYNYDVESVLEDVCMLEYIEGSESIRGGIVMPDNILTKSWRIGRVLLTGPKTNLKVGSTVFFSRDRGIPGKNLNGAKNIIFIRENEIMGVLKKKKV